MNHTPLLVKMKRFSRSTVHHRLLRRWYCFWCLIIGSFAIRVGNGFQVSTTTRTVESTQRRRQQHRHRFHYHSDRNQNRQQISSSHRIELIKQSTTSLLAFLPPSSGGGKSKSELQEIVTSVITVAALIGFFISPLGALFFTVVNSFVAFVLLVPIVSFLALNIWQYFYTITGPCPNCTSPVRVMKDSTPTICFNCGSIVQASSNDNNNNVIVISNPNNDGGLFANEGGDFFSSLFSELGGIEQEKPFVDHNDNDNLMSKTKRTSTVIDVEVEPDDIKK